MSLLVSRGRTGTGRRRRPAAVLVALAATSVIAVAPSAGAPERVAVTGGCRAVGSGDAPTGGGPDRATVVVDTGSGPVWSACVSFSGSISGIEALDRAGSVITDLDPVYDTYGGIGRAVCKLRGVGTAPPDCLGKSVNYWSLSLNGKVAPVGAGAITIEDGDVEGWRYGTGGVPRAATEGTEAAAAPPPTTTTKPPTPTTQPDRGSPTDGGGGMTGSTKPDGTPLETTSTRPGETTTTVEGQTTTTVEGGTTTTVAGEDPKADDDAEVEGASDDGGSDDAESAAGGAAAGSGADPSGDGDGSGGSSVPAALGFVAVIAALGGGAVLVRRRRASAGPPTAAA